MVLGFWFPVGWYVTPLPLFAASCARAISLGYLFFFAKKVTRHYTCENSEMTPEHGVVTIHHLTVSL
jgi:hypothetical protein